jgi:hypothetical protein
MRFQRNRGGWPLRKKTIFDAKARQASERALDRLYRVKEYLRSTVDGQWYDAVKREGDWRTAFAMDVIDQAMGRVHDAFKATNDAAKFMNHEA